MLFEEMKLKGVNVDWVEEFNGSITVCDREGVIVYMNQYSIRQFEKYGGKKLLGTNLIDCHPEPSKSQLIKMLATPTSNMYTTEKGKEKKIIYQTPWMESGEFCGVVELSFLLDTDMVNHTQE